MLVAVFKFKIMSALTKTAEKMQLYFQFGDINCWKGMCKLIQENFKEKKDMPEEVLRELELMKKSNVRTDFTHLAYRFYKKFGIPDSFESGVSRCSGIILSVYDLK